MSDASSASHGKRGVIGLLYFIQGAPAGMVTYFGIAMTFGLIVLAMIYALGDISGAHLNPAVTFGCGGEE